MADIKYLDKTGLGTVKSILEGLFSPKGHKHVVTDITNFPSSMPASDVYDWAKAATKPAYAFNEINPGVATIGDGANRLMFRTHESYRNGMYYSTPGNEALVFATKNPVTSWIFATTDPNSQAAWNGLTPSLQIKNQRVTINKLIPEGGNASYNLDVSGSANATTLYENGTRVSTVGHNHDGSYYTEGEIDTKLAGKSDTSHGHSGIGNGALVHMCSLQATATYNAYKIITNWNKSQNIMPTINIKGYAYGTMKTIDCDIVIYHYDNIPCNYSITNKGSYDIKVYSAIENNVQVFYIEPGEYYGMFNVFVYGGMGTGNFTGWTMETADAVSGTELPKNAIATSVTGNAGSATKLETARTLTIGNTGKSFNGQSNVSWTLAEIGASASHEHPYLPLSGGIITGALDLTNSPNSSDGYKMGSTTSGHNGGGIHFKKNGNNDYGQAITWSHADETSQAGIYVKSSGAYGTKMYLCTTNLFADGSKAALEIDAAGKITALRNNFVGNLTGNASTAGSATIAGDGTITMIPQYNNEINFGGTNASSTLYIGYRAAGSKPIPTGFVFGGSDGSATLTSSGFKKKSSSDSYVLLGGGGHKAISDFLTSLPSHNHDDRYYTESEVDTLLAGKANTSHGTHLPGTVPVSHTNKAISAKGWYVIAQDNKKITHSSVRLVVQRVYNTADNEAYTFEINCAYSGSTSITQVSGVANTQLITKIAVYNPPSPYDRLIYIYYNGTNANDVKVCCMGDFTAQVPTAASIKTTNIREFPTYPIGLFSEEVWSTFSPIGHGHTKVDVGLGNVDNTADANKSVNYANTAGSAPASDVYSWAKAASKPSYNFGEIGAGVATIGDGANRIMFRTNASYKNGIYYSTPGNEALVFGTINPVTSWIFATTDPTSQTAWTSLTPSLQIKNGKVAINKLIASGVEATYNLEVNGNINASNGFFDTSDERLKDFYDDIDINFDKLASIPKKYFSWKDDENKEIHLGTSAQEIQKVYPEIVNESADGELSVDYSKLSVVALAAVDKLYDKINRIEQALIDKGIL